MKDNKLHIIMEDPELPKQLKDARRNHGGMTVPEDFFVQFERKMNAVIDAEIAAKEAEKTPSIKGENNQTVLRPKRWIKVAAMVALVVAVGLALQFKWFGHSQIDSNNVNQLVSVEQLSGDEMEKIEIPEQIEDVLMVSTSDYDAYDIYCGL
ncbi:MAG: hypothetical protein IKX25_08395 [Bacteroidales bacterium]|nr:hypothetical protein [Bacteroidales bacterium]